MQPVAAGAERLPPSQFVPLPLFLCTGDSRFSFLKGSHEHHAYYRHKLEQYEHDLGKTVPKPAVAADAAPAEPPADAEAEANKPGNASGWPGRHRSRLLCRSV